MSRRNSNAGILFKYLKIASVNINQNLTTIKAHHQFRKDFLNSISVLNKKFHLNMMIRKDTIIHNYYQYFLKNLTKRYPRDKEPKCYGKYFKFWDRPHLYYYCINGITKNSSWFLTDSSLAILVCDFVFDIPKEIEQNLALINIEIDLMNAAGFTIAAVFNVPHKRPEIGEQIVSHTLKDHQIVEIHFVLEFTSNPKEKIRYEEFYTILLQNIDFIQGYFYLYRPFCSEVKSCQTILKALRKKPFFYDIGLADENRNIFTFLCENHVRPFPYYSNGFVYDKIRINLSNVALYDSDDEHKDFTPSGFSDIGFGFIKAEDFLNFDKGRVKVYFDNNVVKYCDFDDIHSVNVELYLDDPLYLMEADKAILKEVNTIIDNVFFVSDKFKRKRIVGLNADKKIANLLSYISSSLLNIYLKKIPNFELRNSQVFSALEACRLLLREDLKKKQEDEDQLNKVEKEKKNRKGFIYQVHTGEGKSFIIQMIAAALALYGKTVHIVTSNHFLANRDYNDSYEFFKILGIKTAVLLHKNEKPMIFEDDDPNQDNEQKWRNTNENEENFHYKKERFPDEYFGDSLFDNAANMNMDVCGLGKKKNAAQVIFSTFFNFEALYLRLMEMQPSSINKVFGQSSLLIDEADSILIDEITNGTILSRPMNTNGKEILIYVYKSKMEHKSVDEVLRTIKTDWPRCTDITKRDIQAMFKEIELVNTPEFVNGKKYSIEEMKIDHTDKKLITKIFNELGEIKDKIDNIRDAVLGAPIKAIEKAIELSKSKSPEQLDPNQLQDGTRKKDKLDKNHKLTSASGIDIPTYGRTEEEEKNGGEIKVKCIIPFDYDHKGILEPNKEFNGFIQQFIAIKEMFADPENNKYMFIKDVSMSYLYVSHPIFVKLYSGVCGFTGTIGGKYDKNIFRNHYNLGTLKIPRSKPNHRVDMPIVLCRSIYQRNERIIEEVIQFNQRGNPVLVIFQDLNEISVVYKMLQNRGIININVFDGRYQKIKPDYIAGRKGAISLGTNVCGRGTDIKEPQKPLHVIISYNTSNVRVMQQAFGRTGRKGNRGTVHIICLKEQYIIPPEIIKNDNMIDVLTDFSCKNELQVEFINKFKAKREWIFEPISTTQKLDRTTIGKLRKAQINVNRIEAFNYRFPLCLSIDTFLKIQAQKIFSLFNCPNCKYTWILFQRYIREMIFESWSLFIDRTERHFIGRKHSVQSKNKYMKEQSEVLYEKISRYLPTGESHLGIVETFMWIYNKVVATWEKRVFDIFPKSSILRLKQSNTERFMSFNIGFRPYRLIDCSGARITEVDEDNRKQVFITDPELSYLKQTMKNENPVAVSITEAIDKLFDKICNTISDVIGSFIGIKFFLRRTLGGCEFGLCVDFDLESNDESFNRENCLVDRDPLLVLTISVKSMAPLLAGVLIFALVYLASLSTTILTYVSTFPVSLPAGVVKKTVKLLLEQIALSVLSKQLEDFCQKIIDFLYKKLQQQIEFIKIYDSKMATHLGILSQIINTKEFNKSGEKLNEMFKKKVKIKVNSRFTRTYTKS